MTDRRGRDLAALLIDEGLNVLGKRRALEVAEVQRGLQGDHTRLGKGEGVVEVLDAARDSPHTDIVDREVEAGWIITVQDARRATHPDAQGRRVLSPRHG